MHAWVGRDGRCDPERGAQVLRELDADVIALQEAHQLQEDRLTAPLAELCDQRGYAMVEGPTLVRDEGHYGNAVLSRLPVDAVERADLSVARRESRGALSVGVSVGGWLCHLVTTHFGLRARERRVQVERLLDWIGARVARSGPDAVVLVGDFNEWWPGGAVVRRIEAAFGRGVAPRSFPAWRPWLRLDRIWVEPASLLRRRLGAHRTPLASRASDHLPVVVELEVPGREARRARRAGLRPTGVEAPTPPKPAPPRDRPAPPRDRS